MSRAAEPLPARRVAIDLRTSRGLYRVIAAAPLEEYPDGIALTVAIERADGIERVVLRLRVARELIDRDQPEAQPLTERFAAEPLIARAAPWLEREFEPVREAALKSIRTDHRLFEVVFDSARPGPFTLAASGA